MRKVIGLVMMLAGAYALYWAYKGAAGHFPTTFSFTDPVIQYGAVGAIAFLTGYITFRSHRPPAKYNMACPNCGKLLQKGRRNCPFCKEQLIHY